MFLRNALTMMAVLPLSACFTIIDFGLDDGAGGAGVGGSGNGGAASSVGGSGAGGDGAGGQTCQADLETSAENCGACGHSCEGAACEAGVCQAQELRDMGFKASTIGVGHGRVAALNALAEQVCFVNADGSGSILCQSSADESWDGLGTAIAVDSAGRAYYSPQIADNESPIYRCDGLAGPTSCNTLPQTLVGNASQLNGLMIYGSSVLGVTPYGTVWQVPLEGNSSDATAKFEVLPGDNESYALAVGGGSLLVGQFGAGSAACVVVAEESVLTLGGQSSACTFDLTTLPVVTGVIRLTGVAAGPDGSWAARFTGDLPLASNRALTLTHRGGEPADKVHVLTSLATAAPAAALAGDETSMYFVGRPDASGNRVLRCPYDGEADSCLPISGGVTADAAIAIDDTHVYYAAGEKIFRAVR